MKFELGAEATIVVSGEKGLIVARCERLDSQTQYQIRYKAADGRACETWWDENAIEVTVDG